MDSKYEYDRNGGSWGSVELKGGEITVERHSRYQRTTTGRIVAFPASLLPWYDGEDLNENSDEPSDGPPDPYGEAVLRWLERAEETAGTAITSQIRVIEPGEVVS